MAGVDAELIMQEFREDGGRVTPSRRVIVDVLVELDEGHPTAADIVAAAHRIDPTLHESTIYRTLDVLTRRGVLLPLESGDRATTYHLAHRSHLHLECDSCGGVSACDYDTLAPLADALAATHGFALTPTHTTLHGLCEACR